MEAHYGQTEPDPHDRSLRADNDAGLFQAQGSERNRYF